MNLIRRVKLAYATWIAQTSKEYLGKFLLIAIGSTFAVIAVLTWHFSLREGRLLESLADLQRHDEAAKASNRQTGGNSPTREGHRADRCGHRVDGDISDGATNGPHGDIPRDADHDASQAGAADGHAYPAPSARMPREVGQKQPQRDYQPRADRFHASTPMTAAAKCADRTTPGAAS